MVVFLNPDLIMTFLSLKSVDGSLLLRGQGWPTQFFSLVFVCYLQVFFLKNLLFHLEVLIVLSFSLCLCPGFYPGLLHSVRLASWWIQIYHEDISEVICSVKASLSQTLSHFLAWTWQIVFYYWTAHTYEARLIFIELNVSGLESEGGGRWTILGEIKSTVIPYLYALQTNWRKSEDV